jgi:hypothetical protein
MICSDSGVAATLLVVDAIALIAADLAHGHCVCLSASLDGTGPCLPAEQLRSQS